MNPQFATPHPRDVAIEAAVGELLPWVQDWKDRHQLTGSEYGFILSTLQGRLMQAMCLYEREHLAKTSGVPK